jgi:hypothetical protein
VLIVFCGGVVDGGGSGRSAGGGNIDGGGGDDKVVEVVEVVVVMEVEGRGGGDLAKEEEEPDLIFSKSALTGPSKAGAASRKIDIAEIVSKLAISSISDQGAAEWLKVTSIAVPAIQEGKTGRASRLSRISTTK